MMKRKEEKKMGMLKGLILWVSIGSVVLGFCEPQATIPTVTMPPIPRPQVDCEKCKAIICCKAEKGKVCALGIPRECEKCRIKCDGDKECKVDRDCIEKRHSCPQLQTYPPITYYPVCENGKCTCKNKKNQNPGSDVGSNPGGNVSSGNASTIQVSTTTTTQTVTIPSIPQITITIPAVPPISQPRDCSVCKGFYCAPPCVNIGGGHVCPDLSPPSPELSDFCRKCKEKGEVKCDGDKECKVDRDCAEKKHICLQPLVHPPITYYPACENGNCTCKPKEKRKSCDICNALYCRKDGKGVVTTPELAAFCRKCSEEGKIRCRKNPKKEPVEPIGEQ